MRTPIEFYDLLRNRINISSVVGRIVRLQKKSGEYIGLCPFHSEKTPSFTVNDLKKFYHCFGCGASGDIIKFTSNITGLSYKEAAIKLANDHGIELPILDAKQQKIHDQSKQIFNILELATSFFMSSMNNEVVTYLTKRGITKEAIQEFNIGFAPNNMSLQKFFDSKAIPLMMLEQAGLIGKKVDGNVYSFFRNRIIFPIKDIYNRVIGFGGRIIGEAMPKYLNSPETIIFKKSEVLYGENTALQYIRQKKYVIIVEGYMDVIALNIAGFQAVVATLGTAITEAHIAKLWNMSDEIIVCLDGDSAGQKAAQKLIHTILPTVTHNKVVSFVQLPIGLDPDDVIRRNGGLFLQELIDSRKNLSEIIWDIEYADGKFSSAESKAGLEVRLENYVNQIQDKTLSVNYRRFFKEKIWFNVLKTKNNHNNKLYNTGTNSLTSHMLLSKNNDYSEQELLEHAICAVLVRFPSIIHNEEIRDLLLSAKFSVLSLQYFIEWLLEAVSDIDDLQVTQLEQIVKDTEFYNTYLLLGEPKSAFLSVIEFQLTNKNTNYLLLLKILYKKYQLALLKAEYIAILQNNLGDELTKAKLYQSEVLRVTKELQQFTDSFFNN